MFYTPRAFEKIEAERWIELVPFKCDCFSTPDLTNEAFLLAPGLV